MKPFILFLIPFLIIIFSNSLNVLDLKIANISTSYIGKKGLLLLKISENKQNINQLFNNEDKNKLFKINIYAENKEKFAINCGFLNGLIISEIYISCFIDEDITAGKYSIQINQKFVYLDYQINVIQDKKIIVIKYNYNIPFLYSRKQFIEVKDDINIYELKFKIYSYKNEPLILSTIGNFLPLDNCEEKNEELKCYLGKNEILSIMENSVIWFKLEYIANKEYKTEFQFVDYICIKKSSNSKKKNIKINIRKLLSNCTEKYKYIAYEINIINIPILSTDIFSGFYLDFENGCDYFRSKCRFVKYVDSPLLILCKMEGGDGEYKLKNIKEEIDIDYLNINYNFIIQPVNNTEIFYLSKVKNESFGIMNYQKILDFRKKDSFEIVYYMKNANEITNIRLNDDSNDDLFCTDNKNIKTCIISKNHFKGKENGYYYTSYKNNCRNRAILYEFSPIKVFLN